MAFNPLKMMQFKNAGMDLPNVIPNFRSLWLLYSSMGSRQVLLSRFRSILLMAKILPLTLRYLKKTSRPSAVFRICNQFFSNFIYFLHKNMEICTNNMYNILKNIVFYIHKSIQEMKVRAHYEAKQHVSDDPGRRAEAVFTSLPTKWQSRQFPMVESTVL